MNAVGWIVLGVAAWVTIRSIRTYQEEQREAARRRAAREALMRAAYDLNLWAPTSPIWDETTPLYDQLAAETLAAELDDDAAVAAWMENGS